MNEQRFVVTDRLWIKLEPLLPGKASDAGVTAKDNRLFLEAVFWRVRTGSPWRDSLPGRRLRSNLPRGGHPVSGTGTRSSVAFGVGQKRVFSSAFSMR